jgi:hypothetical protein
MKILYNRTNSARKASKKSERIADYKLRAADARKRALFGFWTDICESTQYFEQIYTK